MDLRRRRPVRDRLGCQAPGTGAARRMAALVVRAMVEEHGAAVCTIHITRDGGVVRLSMPQAESDAA